MTAPDGVPAGTPPPAPAPLVLGHRGVRGPLAGLPDLRPARSAGRRRRPPTGPLAADLPTVRAGVPPENTVAAVLLALDRGADGVEVDVRRWTAGPPGAVGGPPPAPAPAPPPATSTATSTTTAPRRSRLGLGHDPLTAAAEGLDDLLAALRGRGAPVTLVCEVKNVRRQPDYEPAAASVLTALAAALDAAPDAPAALPAGSTIVVSSFDPVVLAAVRAAGAPRAAGWPPATALLTTPRVPLAVAVSRAAAAGHQQVHPHHSVVTATGVRRAHAAGLQVVTWTVPPGRVRRLAALGVHGLIVDDPQRARAALGAPPGDDAGR